MPMVVVRATKCIRIKESTSLITCSEKERYTNTHTHTHTSKFTPTGLLDGGRIGEVVI